MITEGFSINGSGRHSAEEVRSVQQFGLLEFLDGRIDSHSDQFQRKVVKWLLNPKHSTKKAKKLSLDEYRTAVRQKRIVSAIQFNRNAIQVPFDSTFPDYKHVIGFEGGLIRVWDYQNQKIRGADAIPWSDLTPQDQIVLGNITARQAIDLLGVAHQLEGNYMTCSFNVTEPMLNNSFTEQLVQMCDEANVPISALELELHESIIGLRDSHTDELRRIVEKGAKVYLDDLDPRNENTLYQGSLDSDLQVDGVKLDGRIAALHNLPKALDIYRDFLAMARAIGAKTVVCEGAPGGLSGRFFKGMRLVENPVAYPRCASLAQIIEGPISTEREVA